MTKSFAYYLKNNWLIVDEVLVVIYYKFLGLMGMKHSATTIDKRDYENCYIGIVIMKLLELEQSEY